MTFLSCFAQASTRVVWELARVQEPRDWFLPLAALGALTIFVIAMYLADCVEIGRRIAVFLIALRLSALAMAFVVYVQPQKRVEREVVHPSRVAILLDTSLSMALQDDHAESSTKTRLDAVKRELDERGLLDLLTAKHEASIYAFDAELRHLGVIPRKSAPGGSTAERQASPPASPSAPDKEWIAKVSPAGGETRVGDALKQALEREQGNPLSAVILYTDGSQNAGVEPAAAASLFETARVPVMAVGLGSSEKLANVAVREVSAPRRVYPGDDFTITAYIQSVGMSGRQFPLELLERSAGADGGGTILESQQVTLAADGAMVSARLNVRGGATAGTRAFNLRIKAPTDDADDADNAQTADVEVVDRTTEVLLFSGGPSREFLFLRNQLFRDKHVAVDVLLQSASGQVSQDARKILDTFPNTAEELFKYDCLVAFDPDWRLLSNEQIDLIDRWVSEQSGGLIFVAGPVFSNFWIRDDRLSKLRNLHPVEFFQRFARFDDSQFGMDAPRSVQFTEEGEQAEFLWLDDTRAASQQAWREFPGVFGYYSVKGAKPGATIYAHTADPAAAALGEKPIYLAGQFYGSGRAFFLASGEIWRTRALNEAYFEKFYTKLIRHVSEGRLLRGSSRGLLLVERDKYRPGETAQIRARLVDAAFKPLAVAEVSLDVLGPNNAAETVSLRADPEQPGMFHGQFAPRKEGSYELSLRVPESVDERVGKRIQVILPQLERDKPERNDPLLSGLAAATGGDYYRGLSAARGEGGLPPLAGRLKDKTRTTYVTGPPDLPWERSWLRWLLAAACAALCLEWLARRLWRLA